MAFRVPLWRVGWYRVSVVPHHLKCATGSHTWCFYQSLCVHIPWEWWWVLPSVKRTAVAAQGCQAGTWVPAMQSFPVFWREAGNSILHELWFSNDGGWVNGCVFVYVLMLFCDVCFLYKVDFTLEWVGTSLWLLRMLPHRVSVQTYTQ